jgi:hypothetical protein
VGISGFSEGYHHYSLVMLVVLLRKAYIDHIQGNLEGDVEGERITQSEPQDYA